jgi:NhaC family Na+:H+ antiporter
MNVIAGDQYLSIVIPGRMFKNAFEERNLAPKNLSRCLEDSGTLTSPLIPWNTCGAFMIATLGLAPWTYVPYCFLNLINPLVSIFYGFTGITMAKLDSTKA